MGSERKNFTWIGGDHPAGWRRVGWIDVADPADIERALDRGYRIGGVYDGGSESCAEPCTADIYAPERPSHPTPSRQESKGETP